MSESRDKHAVHFALSEIGEVLFCEIRLCISQKSEIVKSFSLDLRLLG